MGQPIPVDTIDGPDGLPTDIVIAIDGEIIIVPVE